MGNNELPYRGLRAVLRAARVHLMSRGWALVRVQLGVGAGAGAAAARGPGSTVRVGGGKAEHVNLLAPAAEVVRGRGREAEVFRVLALLARAACAMEIGFVNLLEVDVAVLGDGACPVDPVRQRQMFVSFIGDPKVGWTDFSRSVWEEVNRGGAAGGIGAVGSPGEVKEEDIMAKQESLSARRSSALNSGVAVAVGSAQATAAGATVDATVAHVGKGDERATAECGSEGEEEEGEDEDEDERAETGETAETADVDKNCRVVDGNRLICPLRSCQKNISQSYGLRHIRSNHPRLEPTLSPAMFAQLRDWYLTRGPRVPGTLGSSPGRNLRSSPARPLLPSSGEKETEEEEEPSPSPAADNTNAKAHSLSSAERAAADAAEAAGDADTLVRRHLSHLTAARQAGKPLAIQVRSAELASARVAQRAAREEARARARTARRTSVRRVSGGSGIRASAGAGANAGSSSTGTGSASGGRRRASGGVGVGLPHLKRTKPRRRSGRTPGGNRARGRAATHGGSIGEYSSSSARTG